MSRARFGTLLALLALAVTAASFLVARSALDDGQPDPPPQGTTESDGDALGSDPVVTTAPTTTAPATGALATPAWIVVVASESDEAGATAAAQAVAAAGHPSGVLRSDDYPSLSAGLWVAYAGPYADSAAAESAVDDLAADGFGGAYARCAGTEDECGGPPDDVDSDDNDD